MRSSSDLKSEHLTFHAFLVILAPCVQNLFTILASVHHCIDPWFSFLFEHMVIVHRHVYVIVWWLITLLSIATFIDLRCREMKFLALLLMYKLSFKSQPYSFSIRHMNVQNCLLINVQYQPISYQGRTANQNFTWVLCIKHCKEFPLQ